MHLKQYFVQLLITPTYPKTQGYKMAQTLLVRIWFSGIKGFLRESIVQEFSGVKI